VILAVGRLRDRAIECLRSLLRQDRIDTMEILLLDFDAGRSVRLPGSDHPSVRVIPIDPECGFASARLRALGEASAPIVAFVEEHCTVFDGWASAILDAYARENCAAVGGEVHNANPHVALSRTIEVMNYTLFMPEARAGDYAILPGHNSSFRLDVLLSYGAELETLLRAEVALYLRMFRDGHRLYLEPRVKFSHLNETRLSSISRGYYLWHRCYGPVRAKVFGWSLPRRALYVAAVPVIPLYYLVRLARVLLRRRPSLLPRMIRGVPAIFVSQLASAAGQAVGLLFGIGDAERKFTDYELNHPRGAAADRIAAPALAHSQ
jgi:glycosyl transferase family 2